MASTQKNKLEESTDTALSGEEDVRLRLEHLGQIYDFLCEISTKWTNIGLQLGISVTELEKIEYRCGKLGPDKCLLEMLMHWLKNAAEPKDYPSRSVLVRALKRTSVGEAVLATKLEQLHLTCGVPTTETVNGSSASQNYSVNQPLDLGFQSCKVQSESFATTCSPASSTPSQHMTTSNAGVQCDFSKETTDCQNSSTSDLDSQGETKSMPYSCSCDIPCSIDDFVSGRCQNPVSSEYTFRFLNTQSLSESQKSDLTVRLEEDYRKIILQYARLTSSLRQSLCHRQITPVMLADCLMEVRNLPPIAKNEKHELGYHYEEIKSAKDIMQAFEILHNYGSFFDYDIIAFLVEQIGCGEVKKELKSYKVSFEDYCKRHVFECPFYSQKNSKSSDIVVKIGEVANLGQFTLNSLKRFQLRLAEILGIKKRTLRVCGVAEGCLEIILQVPLAFESLIFPLSPEVESQLRDLGVTSLNCGDYCFDHPKPKEETKSLSSKITKSEGERSFPKRKQGETNQTPQKRKYGYPAMPGKVGSQTLTPARAVLVHTKRQCFDYMLLGGCARGKKCWYSHDYKISNPAEARVEVAQTMLKQTKSKGYSPSGKGYIYIIESSVGSSPTKNVKIVAEDHETVEFVAFQKLRVSREQFRSGPQMQPKPKAKVRRLKPCMMYKLTGGCHRVGCNYSHEGYQRKEDYLSLPRQLPPGYHANLHKLCRNPTSGKFYILLKSERDPKVTRELKISAEDQDTIHFVRDNLFDCLDHTKVQESMPVATAPLLDIPKPCPDQIILGRCTRQDRCEWDHSHKRTAVRPRSAFFETEGNFAQRIVGCVGHGPDVGCYVISSLFNERTRVKILAETDMTLEYVKRELTAKMGSVDTTPHTGYNYIHPEGVEVPDMTLTFTKQDGSDDRYQLVSREGSRKPLNIDNFEHLNPKWVPPLYSRLVNLENKMSLMPRTVQLKRDYRNDIHDRLRDGLTWMYENGLYPKLEGRFGKILWRRYLKDETFDVERFITYALTESMCRQCSFSAGIAGKGPAALKRSCIREIGFNDETYNFNLQTNKKGEGKLNIRVKFRGGIPKVILVKKSEYKVVMFDIICLHRENDIRISLHSFEPASVDDPRVRSFISTLKMTEYGVINFAPKASNGEWTVTHIRHKKWEGYYFRDYKYVVTISTVGSYDIQEADLRQNKITLGPKTFGLKHEAELHNVVWECAFTGRLSLTSEQNTFLHMNENILPTQAIPTEWTPDTVMEDFEKDGFLQMMDDLNTAMQLVSADT